MISNILETNSNLKRLLLGIENNKKISVLNVGEGEVLGILGEINRPKLFVVANMQEAKMYYEKFLALKYKVTICTSIPNLFLSEVTNDVNEYTDFLKNVFNNTYEVIIVTPNVLMLSVPKNINSSDNMFVISVDKTLTPQDCEKALTQIGYKRVDSISMAGEFSYRGEVIDIVVFGSSQGYRIIFDYDNVDKIKILDDEYIEAIDSVSEVVLGDRNYLEVDHEKIISETKKNPNIQQLYQNYKEFNTDINNLWFLPYSKVELVPILDILPNETIVVYSDAKRVYDSASDYVNEYDIKVKEGKKDGFLLKSYNNPLKLENLTPNTEQASLAFHYINNANKIFAPNLIFTFKSMPNVNYGENYKSLILDLQNNLKTGYTTILFVSNDNYEIVIRQLNGKCLFTECKSFLGIQRNTINVINKEYYNSFNFYDEKLCVIGSNNIGKQINVQNIDTKKLSTNMMTEIELPKENDYVVHKIHGIGKCLGIQTLELSKDNKKEYVIIEYKNEDKLYLPIENVDSITKYIGDDDIPSLNKLGGVEFQKLKEKVKTSVKDIANELINVYKKREQTKGFIYPEDDDLQLAFENAFPYPLTFDQESVLLEVKKEMCSGKLIDRLICGDVGFGKTEVAIRLAFKTLLAGKSVAVLCPTTILSEQHYNTFNNRMKDFGININVLNRFKSATQTKKIIEDLQNGSINVIIGTHKLLNKEVKFNNLGLLIIDEEQKFGVEHKEKIKALKKDVNVITLSATPIPRTLHLSLSGIRDISTIQTPPVNKLSTQVNVTEFNETTIKIAIDRELKRNGQILIIYNRVESIESVANLIKRLVGEDVAIDVAHGQMASSVLENKIMNLYNGKTQILVSTTLIENGVDLPNANTLIVLDADKLGLSQLYQLKGRVGRGNRESYAYFMYSDNLSDIAYKRLKAISEFTAMGSGFKIAMRDMELRGAGNIFGSQQHGHLVKIGYAMYMKILNSTIDELKNNVKDNSLYREIKIETDLLTNIPNNSKFTTNQKMLLYNKIASIRDVESYNQVLEQIKDIYSFVPESLANLCKLSIIKNKLYQFDASKIVIKRFNCYIEFDKNVDINSIKPLISDKSEIEILPNSIALKIKVPYESCLNYILSILIK